MIRGVKEIASSIASGMSSVLDRTFQSMFSEADNPELEDDDSDFNALNKVSEFPASN